MHEPIKFVFITWTAFITFFVFSFDLYADGCNAKISTEGSFFSGRTFRSSMLLPNSNKSTSFDKIVATLAEDGWQIVSSNKSAGFISVNQMINFGKGMTVPLNVTVKNHNQGIKIKTSMKTPSGTMVKKSYIKSTFCKVYNAAKDGTQVTHTSTIIETRRPASHKTASSSTTLKNKCSVQKVLKLIDAGLSENEINNICD